jgi:hypothetical protein
MPGARRARRKRRRVMVAEARLRGGCGFSIGGEVSLLEQGWEEAGGRPNSLKRRREARDAAVTVLKLFD